MSDRRWAEECDGLRETLRHAMNTIVLEADQLDTWAQQSVEGGWSTHQVEPMRKRADVLRREASLIVKQMAAERVATDRR